MNLNELTLWHYLAGAVAYVVAIFKMLDYAEKRGWGIWK